MMVLLVIAGVLITIFFGIQIFSLVMLAGSEKGKIKKPVEWPKVSLLLAARNEEQLIIRSLEAIDALDYPEGKLEVLVGDDNSTDSTYSLVESFINNKPKFRLISVRETLGKARGKANVLAHLAHKATGEIFLITDVDVQLPMQWVKAMVAAFDEKTGIVSGTTMCERGNMFATLQSIDWLHFMGYIKAFANAGVSCTSVGNNMAVRAEAYQQTGGYEEMRFSITEDYRLFENVTKAGWGWKNILSPETLGKAWYIPSVREMLHQRKRWLIGARDLPLNWKLMLILYGSFVPALIFILVVYPEFGLGIWGMKLAIQSIFIALLTQKVGEKPFKMFQLITYEFYVLLNTTMTAVFYFLPIRSEWKGRVYRSDNITD